MTSQWDSDPTGADNSEKACDLRAWMRAARSFELNEDFDIYNSLRERRGHSLADLMGVMKKESAGKRTIQALADKLMLHKMLNNMDVPQLPALLTVTDTCRPQDIDRDIRNFVAENLCREDAEDVVLKPSHLSNGLGVLVLSKVAPEQLEDTSNYLVNHVRHFMAQHGGAHESLALQSLKPGFIAQPKYNCVVGFKTPLELRVVSIWGRVRMGLWWWGRHFGAVGEVPQRNAWLVRRPKTAGVLSGEDGWEVLHQHQGYNPGFDAALALFERHMPAMAATAEAIAAAFGAPFLRADFFVGSADWGVRLNEVAYGCGVDYRAKPEDGRIQLADDAPRIAQLLEDGLLRCRRTLPPQHFLDRLGITGQSYQTMTVARLPNSLCLHLPPNALQGGAAGCRDEEAREHAVPEELCFTPKRELIKPVVLEPTGTTTTVFIEPSVAAAYWGASAPLQIAPCVAPSGRGAALLQVAPCVVPRCPLSPKLVATTVRARLCYGGC